jgi:alpha/beta superfamily hydrolase
MPLREIPGPVGRLEAVLDEPVSLDDPERAKSREAFRLRAAVVLAHAHPRYGGTMHMKTLYHCAKALVRIDCAVLRFNFRGTGLSAGDFDEGRGEQEDFRAAMAFMRQRNPDAPLWTGGMSFGAWIALVVGASDPRVSTLIGLSTPVCRYDFAVVADSATPKFFIHGERDEVCSLKQMREFYGRAREPKELVVIDAADHLFDGKVSEVADTMEDLFSDWGHGGENSTSRSRNIG